MPQFSFQDNLHKQNLERERLEQSNMLAKFALLRWDELPELATRLGEVVATDGVIGKKQMAAALSELRDGSWRTLRDYFDYSVGPSYERRDFGKLNTWIIEGLTNRNLPPPVRRVGALDVLSAATSDPMQIKIDGYKVSSQKDGRLRLTKRRERR
jgi:hypothetical protein